MRNFIGIFSILLAVVCTVAAEGKLQIGVKKRVENCTYKTRKNDLIHIHYTVTGGSNRFPHHRLICIFVQGKLEDGTEFDSSIPRGQPLTFTLGTGQVIKGWDQGLLGMCEGEKRRLVIPSELAYGQSGAGDKIKPGATLIFETELIKIERKDEL